MYDLVGGEVTADVSGRSSYYNPGHRARLIQHAIFEKGKLRQQGSHNADSRSTDEHNHHAALQIFDSGTARLVFSKTISNGFKRLPVCAYQQRLGTGKAVCVQAHCRARVRPPHVSVQYSR
jgi:hypothetical protein